MRKLSILFSTILVVLLTLVLAVGCQQEPAPSPPPEVTYTLDVTVNPSGTGSVSLSPSGGTYDADTEVTITATPAHGYIFDHWSGDVTGTSNPINLTMDRNRSVTAHFKAHLEDGIIFQDNFVDSNNWLIDADAYIEDGAYHKVIHVEEGRQRTCISFQWPPAAPNFPDFGYEAEVTKIQGDDHWPHGLVFLCQNPKAAKDFYHLFMVYGNGAYIFSRVEEDNITHTIHGAESPYIRKGNVSNELKVICRNSIIELYVNDHLLETVSGEFPPNIGGNGIGLVVIGGSGITHIAFDNIKMWVVTP